METEAATDATKRVRNAGGLSACIANCLECSRVCLETAAACVAAGGEHAETDRIAMLFNCAEISQLAGKFMISGSPVHLSICRASADVCDVCAADCRSVGPELEACAEACARCAESCREILAQH
jgi:hypothetical protein